MTPTRGDVEYAADYLGDAYSDPTMASRRDFAAMLRALLARAEAAEAELAVEQEARELASESDAGWEQVANAARAELARLREAVETFLRVSEDDPSDDDTCAMLEYADAVAGLRAALTVEARDE